MIKYKTTHCIKKLNVEKNSL